MKNLNSSTISVFIRFIITFILGTNLIPGSVQIVHAANAVLFVSPSGSTSGNCDSWTNACDLQYALSIAVATDKIWVMQGTYKPTTSTDRTISFVLNDGVALYGGFAGTESSLDQRSNLPQLTILSGDIGTVTDISDNSYHVMVTSNTGVTTIIDGLTITKGNANGALPNNLGAGIYNDTGSPQLNNVIIESNSIFHIDLDKSGAGAGMYNINGNPTFTNVVFKNNEVTLPSMNFNSCLGGGLYNENSSITMSNVTFLENHVSTPNWGPCGGAGIYNKNSTANLLNMTFTGNTGSHMGWPNASLGSAGGGIWNIDSNVTIQIAVFNENKAHFGGGIMNRSGTLVLQNAVFNNNTAYYYGGGIRHSGVDGSSIIINDSTFSGNSAGLLGGGFINMYSSQSIITLTSTTFSGNIADGGGGFSSVSDTTSTVTISNVTFSDNSADYLGGGGYLIMSNATVKNSTFSNNHDTSGGGALYNNGASPSIQNSIFWGNSSEIFNDSTTGNGISAPTIIDSVISTGCPAGATCTNIITTDPKLGPLADNGGSTQTLALGDGSSAIDMGAQNSTCAATDQRGVMRPQGGGCDIGAYEALTSFMLVNSVLPTSRSVQVGSTATIYHTVINPNANAVQNVTLSMANAPAGTFTYQQTNCATNGLIGSMNPVLDISAGGVICYVLMFTPSAAFDATNAYIRVETNAMPVSNLYPGINTWLLRATNVAGPDIIAQTTTADLLQVECSGAMAFAVATSNVGATATGDITVTANTGAASLPISVSIQETNPGTGAIIGDHILNNLGAGENRTVAVFVTFNGCINFNPALNRIFIEFRDASNNVVGSTSTAVSTNR